MNANQMMLAAEDTTAALGPHNLQPEIAGRKCTLVICPPSHVTVMDDRGACHDFYGCTWPEIKASMTDYFWAVDCGR